MYLESVALSPQHMVGRDNNIIEVHLSGVGGLDAHLLLGGTVRDAAHAPVNNEPGHLVSGGA